MIAEHIRAELAKARQLDDAARQHRQRAGELLRCCENMIETRAVARAAGLDARMVQLLLHMPPVI